MSYFYSPQAEYRAKRIAQLMAHAGEHAVSAMRDGRCVVNMKGHVHCFTLDEAGQLQKTGHSVDYIIPKQEFVLTE